MKLIIELAARSLGFIALIAALAIWLLRPFWSSDFADWLILKLWLRLRSQQVADRLEESIEAEMLPQIELKRF